MSRLVVARTDNYEIIEKDSGPRTTYFSRCLHCSWKSTSTTDETAPLHQQATAHVIAKHDEINLPYTFLSARFRGARKDDPRLIELILAIDAWGDKYGIEAQAIHLRSPVVGTSQPERI